MKNDNAYYIMFYHPKSTNCKKLMPTWLGAYLKNRNNTRVIIGRVDCTNAAAKQLCKQFAIKGYPTLKFLKGDKMYESTST